MGGGGVVGSKINVMIFSLPRNNAYRGKSRCRPFLSAIVANAFYSIISEFLVNVWRFERSPIVDDPNPVG